jgi:hypothetical protein
MEAWKKGKPYDDKHPETNCPDTVQIEDCIEALHTTSFGRRMNNNLPRPLPENLNQRRQ